MSLYQQIRLRVPLLCPQRHPRLVLSRIAHMQESVSNSGSTVVPGIHFAEVRARITRLMSWACRLRPLRILWGSGARPVSGPSFDLTIEPRAFRESELHIYRCFKCGSSGNQLDLYAAVTGLGVFEATVALCEQLHREIPWILNGTSAQARTASRFVPDQPCSHEVVASPAGELA